MIAITVYLVGLYFALGLVFAIPFVFLWNKRIDPVVKDSTLGFKVLTIPGVALLWPYLVLRVRQA